jgi:hypothetical protein
MNTSSGPRKTASDLSESARHRLHMYAIAAGAAGVGVLALAQPVEAKIVYTPANVNIGLNGVELDLNNDGITDVLLLKKEHKALCYFLAPRVSFFEYPAAGNGIEGAQTPLDYGARIGRGRRFSGQALLASSVFVGAHSCHHNGGWWNVKDRYLGVKFKVNGTIHYGWARLSFDRGRAARLTGYAYETIPGKSIIAGKTHGPTDEAVEENFGPSASLTNPIPDAPQPASLGMLALGAPGVPLWRREEW